jgi:tetratricopeptide (TPR) repeat protein
VQALLGIARYELDRLAESVAAFRVALRNGTRYGARSLYTMGAALSRLGEDEEAQDAFARLLHEHPRSPEAFRLREAGEARLRAWTLQALASFLRDDNPVRGTQVDDLAPEIPPPDWMAQAHVSAERRFPGSWPTARASVFRMDYRQADDLDFTLTEARIEGPLHPSPRTRIVPGYSFRLSWLGRERYDVRHAFDVGVTRAIGRSYSSTFRVSAAREDHPDATFQDLDGTDVAGSLELSRRGRPGALLQSIRARLGGGRDGAGRDYLEHADREAEADARLAMPARSTLAIALRWRGRDFARTDPRFGARRKDDRRIGSVSLTVSLSAAVWARLGVTLADNESTIGRYDYRQVVTGLTVGARL